MLKVFGVGSENWKPLGAMRWQRSVKEGGKVENEPADGSRQPCVGGKEGVGAGCRMNEERLAATALKNRNVPVPLSVVC